MKVLIDNNPNEFISISSKATHFQCNTLGNASAHNFNMHPKHYPKNTPIKANGHTYIFPSYKPVSRTL